MNIYKAHPDIVYVEEENHEALLFDPNTGNIKVLNTTAAFIYRHLDGTRKCRDIVAMMEEAFQGATRDELERDMAEFVEECKKREIIETQ
jgi:hypothetical protein